MLATVGWIATDMGMRVPGPMFAKLSTLDAHDFGVKFGSMAQMTVWAGYFELFAIMGMISTFEGTTDRKPGDFGVRWGYPKDEQGQYDMQLKELRNGRLAMLAFGGIATVGQLTGETWPFLAGTYNALPSDKATEGRGATLCGGSRQAPSRRTSVAANAMYERSRSMPFLPKPQNIKGFAGEEAEFDPLGFSDTFDIRWLREAELKHGRVCMLASVGFVAQQYLTFPGFKPTPD